MKLLGEGGMPKPLVMLGDEKSSISSLKITPVCGDITIDPKLRLKRKIIIQILFRRNGTQHNYDQLIDIQHDEIQDNIVKHNGNFYK